MKICFMAPANNYHTIKWARWFSNNGNEVYIISFTKGEIENCKVYYIDTGADVHGNDLQKLKYLLYAVKVQKIVKGINPDVINVHYATSYGTVAGLAKLPHYYLSVWGSDIYDFPRKGLFHKMMLKFSLKKATYLMSTSRAMAKEASKYTLKNFYITPFGVDCELFSPQKTNGKVCDLIDTKNGTEFIVGTIKSLSDKYGIATMLKAIAIFRNNYKDIPIRVKIAGKGPQELEYKKLAKDLKIENVVEWLGYITQEQAAIEWANMDCGIIPSELESESFGVSAVEAQASGTPVIISDIPGLMEATVPGKTSVVFHRKNPDELAKALYDIYENKDKRMKLGCAGRTFVCETYELNKCFEVIMEIYKKNCDRID